MVSLRSTNSPAPVGSPEPESSSAPVRRPVRTYQGASNRRRKPSRPSASGEEDTPAVAVASGTRSRRGGKAKASARTKDNSEVIQNRTTLAENELITTASKEEMNESSELEASESRTAGTPGSEEAENPSKDSDSEHVAKEVEPEPEEEPSPQTSKAQPVLSPPAPSTLPSGRLDASAVVPETTGRKRKGSPAVSKPSKRRKGAAESQLKKSLAEDTPSELICFKVVVLGDANASVKVQIPARIQNGRRAAPAFAPPLVPIYPYSVVRRTSTDSTKPTSSNTVYLFPLPDRRVHESFHSMKVRIKTNGERRAAKVPSLKGFESGQVSWLLEADRERCRWIPGV
ncbi:uncharacterized protein JCM6883_000746 [Sporobolomyces salmoneus]|uniref:uncharacterized protein n=1 Tax=Sporobolomyces salmoneus TaxID=183962 RepID=UPI003175B471